MTVIKRIMIKLFRTYDSGAINSRMSFFINIRSFLFSACVWV